MSCMQAPRPFSFSLTHNLTSSMSLCVYMCVCVCVCLYVCIARVVSVGRGLGGAVDDVRVHAALCLVNTCSLPM